MGSLIEINDTLKISKERGFPKELTLEQYLDNSEIAKDFLGKEFNFFNSDERLYNRSPTRVFLVEEMSDGKWLHWGHALILSQTIEELKTSGIYMISRLYSPEFQKFTTIEQSPEGKSFFDDKSTSYYI